MSRTVNPLLMVIPEAAMASILALLVVAGGLLVLVGARRAGLALVGTAVAIPVVAIAVEALLNDVFTALPDSLVQPLAWGLTGLCYLLLLGMVLKLLVGQKAVDAAKGQLLADAIKGLVRIAFRWPAMLLWGSALSYLAWRAV